MTDPALYLVADGSRYIVVEDLVLGREKFNLALAARLANDEIARIKLAMSKLDDDSGAYENLRNELNDLEMLVADFGDRLEVLMNLPGL